ALAAATPVALRDTLQPWEIIHLYTHSPSGRPGNSPYLTLNVTISDPNTLPITQTPTGTAIFPPSSVNCSAEWLEHPPIGQEIECTASDYAKWTMTMTPGTDENGYGSTQEFGLEFKLVDSVRVLNVPYTRVFTGGDQFKVGVNMQGQCGGSGTCNWAI
ncbi:hypothetical protein GQ43DRAFT_350607, partial [Delitschia confertaspora ATCC 74209]